MIIRRSPDYPSQHPSERSSPSHLVLHTTSSTATLTSLPLLSFHATLILIYLQSPALFATPTICKRPRTLTGLIAPMARISSGPPGSRRHECFRVETLVAVITAETSNQATAVHRRAGYRQRYCRQETQMKDKPISLASGCFSAMCLCCISILCKTPSDTQRDCGCDASYL